MARELGYQRNQLAHAMITGKSRILGFLTSPEVEENSISILTGAVEASIAMVVQRVARSLGLILPYDLSVTGYGNDQLSTFADPPLTSVDQSFSELGHAAVLHLIQPA